MSIMRTWHGEVPLEKADAYEKFMVERAAPDYGSVEGLQNLYFQRRDEGDTIKMAIEITLNSDIEETEVVALYEANAWSSARKPKELLAALRGSHTLVIARSDAKLVGIGNAISDGHLVVYYPHMLVHPDYQGKGIGKKMMQAMQSVYGDFHQQMLTADGRAVDFYKTLGFERAGKTEPMWIYAGNDH